MQAILVAIMGLSAFVIGYFVYSKFIAEKIFRLDPAFRTPAHEFNDGVDYVPTNKYVLWGHHFTSVAGAAPIVGPAIAVIWGWVPAFLWVVLGTIFFAGVHDFSALVISARHKGESIGSITKVILGPRAKILFLFIIFMLLLMVNAVFAVVITGLFLSFPGSVLPWLVQIPIAIAIGFMVYRGRAGIVIPSFIALVILYFFIYLGTLFPIAFPETLWGLDSAVIWILLLFLYAAIASILPVWTLLQPRDFINALQLFVALGIGYVGMLFVNPEIVAPAFNDPPAGTPPLIPILFITIACGAISGFHGLVASGTTSKQLNKEPEARFVGYFGAIGEGSLALLSILAATAGFATFADWNQFYAEWGGINAQNAFVQGIAVFASGLGIPEGFAIIFASVMIVNFAATTMDTGVRLQRYIVGEIGQAYNIPFLTKSVWATLIAVGSCLVLAFSAEGGRGGMLIWPLFGTTNQLTAGLTLTVVSLYLKRLGRPIIYTMVPMIFILIMTTIGMIMNLGQYFAEKNILLSTLGVVILGLAFWLIIEAIAAFRNNDTRGLES
ncbi:MAG: carbon starvation protein A [Bacillaceae bacterium]|nr:carbon starvation protein A [Bacillaceae bacterium]